MPAADSAPISATRRRLLDAARRICEAHGLQGATTRAIADEARVNEVTLFRHFGSKDKLIAMLFAESVAAQVASLEITEPHANDLGRDLRRYAQRFNQMLFEHEALIRTIIGEARRHPEQARQVISDSVKPMRQRLLDYLRSAQKAGSVRRDLHLPPTVDAFTGMLLSGMLRRTGLSRPLDYSQEDFVETVVELFLRGIAAPAQKPRNGRRA